MTAHRGGNGNGKGSSIGSGTYEGSNSLTSSIQMREQDSTFNDGSTNSLTITSSMNMRGENSTSTCSSFDNELSLPSSFASTGDRSSSAGAGITSLNSFLSKQTDQKQQSQDGDGNGNSQAMEVYNGQGQVTTGESTIVASSGDDDNDDGSINSEKQLELRISKETKPMMHLLRLLKEFDGDNNQMGDPKAKAVASLMSEFEQEVSTIEHRIKDENLIVNGEQLPLPLPPNWIALEDPDSGDIYFANEATGETQWERPGLGQEVTEKLDAMKHSNIGNDFLEVNNNDFEDDMQNSNISNNYEQGTMQNSNISNDYEQGTMQNSNISNDYEQGTMQNNSKRGNNDNFENTHDESIQNSNVSNNYQQGMQNSNVSNNYQQDTKNSNESNNINNFEDSHNNMTNTLESSLTDSNPRNINNTILPDADWTALEDPDSGETYYANEVTGETTWDKPSMPQSLPPEEEDDSSVDLSLPPDWVALEDAESGDTYYLNQATMSTTWDRPAPTGDEKVEVVETDANSQQPSENDTESNNDDLPPGWEAILEPSSGDYYYAHESGETQWEHPVLSQSDNNIANNDNEASSDENRQPVGDDDDEEEVDDLPPGWFAAIDQGSGDQYFCNEATGETTWDFPAEPAIETNNPNQAPVGDDEGDDDLPPNWFAAIDEDSGDPYFCNEETGETTWDRPTSTASGNSDANEHIMSRLSLVG